MILALLYCGFHPRSYIDLTDIFSYIYFLGWGLLAQLLENHIKNELIENSQLVHALPSSEESKLPMSEPRRSASIACGASVFEVSLKVPAWASQVTFSYLLHFYGRLTSTFMIDISTWFAYFSWII